jgi:RNA polymerase sigma factor (sigma-70 family)
VGRDFADAFQEEFPQLHRYLYRRVGRDLADELAAETFATAYANWSRFDDARPLRPWLYGIAANLLRHHWRSERRQLEAYARTGLDPVADDLDESVARADARVQRRQLAAVLAELQGRERDILLLHAWAGLTDTEIAEALGLPVGTVKSRLHRTRAYLRNRLERGGQVRAEASVSIDREAL